MPEEALYGLVVVFFGIFWAASGVFCYFLGQRDAFRRVLREREAQPPPSIHITVEEVDALGRPLPPDPQGDVSSRN